MLNYQQDLEREFHSDPSTTNGDFHFDSVRTVFEHSADDVVDAMLFKNEAALPKNIVGSPAFQKSFAAGALRAKEGDSLKDLLISGHLFKNRCSYLIYSDSFREPPAPLKTRIYTRLARALDAVAPDTRYNYIDAAERGRIRKILDETCPEFRQYCAASPKSSGPAQKNGL